MKINWKNRPVLAVVVIVAAVLAIRGTMYGLANYSTALRTKAEQGDGEAALALGDMHSTGIGAPKTYAEAAKWYREAAEQGMTPAQTSLGWLYENGWGVKQDYAEACFWYMLAEKSSDRLLPGLIDETAMHLTPAQMEAVRKRVQEWKPTAVRTSIMANSPGDSPSPERAGQ